MIHAAQRLGGNAELEAATQLLGCQCHITQVWKKPATGTVLGVGNIVPGHNACSSQITATGHGGTFQTKESVARWPKTSAGAGEVSDCASCVKHSTFILQSVWRCYYSGTCGIAFASGACVKEYECEKSLDYRCCADVQCRNDECGQR